MMSSFTLALLAMQTLPSIPPPRVQLPPTAEQLTLPGFDLTCRLSERDRAANILRLRIDEARGYRETNMRRMFVQSRRRIRVVEDPSGLLEGYAASPRRMRQYEATDREAIITFDYNEMFPDYMLIEFFDGTSGGGDLDDLRGRDILVGEFTRRPARVLFGQCEFTRFEQRPYTDEEVLATVTDPARRQEILNTWNPPFLERRQ
jgi:hypothetical protein